MTNRLDRSSLAFDWTQALAMGPVETPAPACTVGWDYAAFARGPACLRSPAIRTEACATVELDFPDLARVSALIAFDASLTIRAWGGQ